MKIGCGDAPGHRDSGGSVAGGRAEGGGRGEAWISVAAAARQILFVGCGSSYNVAVLAAAGWNALAGVPPRAVSAGEYLRFRATACARPREEVACFLSRSGVTSEIVAAVRQARADGCSTLALCCTEASPLAVEADLTLALPAALEEAIIATRSVTAMGLAALLTAALMGDRRTEAVELRSLPESVHGGTDAEFGRDAGLLPAGVERVVFLGSGPLWGTALAAQLVCQEMALVDAWAYPTLEFRHGPIVLARPGTLVVLFATAAAEDLDAALFQDLTARGCRRLWVGPPRPTSTRRRHSLSHPRRRIGRERSCRWCRSTPPPGSAPSAMGAIPMKEAGFRASSSFPCEPLSSH